MSAADVVVVGSGEFVGETGVIHTREVKKGKTVPTYRTRTLVTCQEALTPQARREAMATLMRRNETLTGTFYLRRLDGDVFTVDIYVPSNPSAQATGARQDH